MDADGPELVPVHIVGLPLDVYRRASEHSDELLREFALIREEQTEQVPGRLLALVDELQARFGGFTSGPSEAIQAALARGDTMIDLRYDVPAGVGEAALHLSALLDEADEFCRSGDLLTLATAPEGLAFRRWFLGEFANQLTGHPPTPWSAPAEPTVMEGTDRG